METAFKQASKQEQQHKKTDQIKSWENIYNRVMG